MQRRTASSRGRSTDALSGGSAVRESCCARHSFSYSGTGESTGAWLIAGPSCWAGRRNWRPGPKGTGSSPRPGGAAPRLLLRKQPLDFVQDGPGDLPLAQDRRSRPPGRARSIITTWLSSASIPTPGRETSLATIRSRLFSASFRRALASTSSRLGGEADEELVLAGRLGGPGRPGCPRSGPARRTGPPARFLIFCGRGRGRPEIRHRRGHDHHVRADRTPSGPRPASRRRFRPASSRRRRAERAPSGPRRAPPGRRGRAPRRPARAPFSPTNGWTGSAPGRAARASGRP